MTPKFQWTISLILILFHSSKPASASDPAPAPELTCAAIFSQAPAKYISVNIINSGSSRSMVEVTDQATGLVKALVINSDKRLSVAKAHPDGKRFIAISNEDKTLRVYSAEDGRELSRLKLNLLIDDHLNFNFDVSPDGNSVLVWGSAEKLWLKETRVFVKFDLRTNKRLFRNSYDYKPGSSTHPAGNHNGQHHILDAKISGDGKYALVQLFGGLWGVIDYETGYLLFEKEVNATVFISPDQPNPVQSSPGFRYLKSLQRFFIHTSGTIEILTAGGELLKSIPAVNQVVLRDHKSALASHANGTVVLYDLENLAAVSTVNTGNLGTISRMFVTTDNRLILQMAVENKLYTTHVFDINSDKKIITAVAPLGNSGQKIEGLTPIPNGTSYIHGVSSGKTTDYVDKHGLYLYQRFDNTTTVIERIYDLVTGELVGSLDSSFHFVPILNNVSKEEFIRLAHQLFEEFNSN